MVQAVYAEDYPGATVTFRAQVRTASTTGQAGLFLRVIRPEDTRGPVTAQSARADPGNHIVTVEDHDGWTGHEVTAPVPDDVNTVAFGIFLAGPGRVELRDAELTR